jgi:hypothetical protein
MNLELFGLAERPVVLEDSCDLKPIALPGYWVAFLGLDRRKVFTTKHDHLSHEDTVSSGLLEVWK